MTDSLAFYNRPSSSQLLARILDAPDLAAQVQALPPAILGRLIAHVGVEDAGELVALATTEQLAQVFDDDLWRSDHPGEDEHFDADRFLIWLHVMLEAGDSFVAQKLFELPEDLVTLAFHRQLLVLNVEQLMADVRDAEDADTTEKALSDCLSEELDEYQLISRQHEGWDNVLAAVLALDRDHHEFLVGILERCCKMSSDYIEDNGGLYEVLTSEEMLETDVAGDREQRRAEEGHVAPSAAAAFLKLARAPSETAATEHDPLTRAYFRGLAKSRPAKAPREQAPRATEPKGRDLLRLLESSGISEPTGAPRLPAPTSRGEGAITEPLLIRALARLSDQAPQQFFARSEEIAYLANVLVAGCSFQGHRLRPVEAVRAAIATCSLGLELVENGGHGDDRLTAAVIALAKYPADGLFRVAWSRLNSDVIQSASQTTQRLLRNQAVANEVQAEDFSRVAARIETATAEGMPWKAIPELATLYGALDTDVIATLSGYMDECPTMSHGVDDLRFISMASDLLVVRKRLALVLRRR